MTETPEGFLVSLKNGAQIRVTKVGEIEFNIANAEAGLGRKLQPNEKPVAAWKPMHPQGMVIQLTEQGMGSLPHEVFHAAVTLALSKGQITALMKKYMGEGMTWKEAEEQAAEAYQKWRDAKKQKPDTFFLKIMDFFRNIKEKFFPTVEGAFREIESGRAWSKKNGLSRAEEMAMYANPNQNRAFDENTVTGYANVPDKLMGFGKGENKGFSETKYPYELPVHISFDNGATWETDAIKGMNPLHALERARRNWEGALIRTLSEADRTNENYRFNTQAESTATAESLLDRIGTTMATTNFGSKFDRFAAFMMPMNRILDWFKDRESLQPIKPIIEKLQGVWQKQVYEQDNLLSKAELVRQATMDACKKDKGVGTDEHKIEQLERMMSTSTFWQLYPDKPFDSANPPVAWPGDLWRGSGMEAKTGLTLEAAQNQIYGEYKKMSPAMQKAYQQMLDLNNRAWKTQKKVNLEHVKIILKDSPHLAKALAAVEKRFNKVAGPYFSLSRFGEHIVRIKEPDVVDEEGNIEKFGKSIFSMAFESKQEALDFANSIEKDPRAFLRTQVKNADSYPALQTSYDYRPKITRNLQNIPETFLEKIKAATSKLGMVDLRKTLRAINRDMLKEIQNNNWNIPQALQDKVLELSKAQTQGEAARITDEIEKMITKTQEEKALFDEITSAIDGAALDAGVAESLKHDFEQIWMQSLPETSVMKHFVRRKGVLGYSEDMMRSFLAYHQKHARAMAFIKYGTQVNRLLNEMNQKAQELDTFEDKASVQEFAQLLREHQLHMMTEKVSNVVKQMTKIPFVWYLSSPSVFLVQSSQPYTITLPFLAARHGFSKAFNAINKAYGRQLKQEFTDGKILAFIDANQDLIDRLKDLDDAGDTKGVNEAVKNLSMQEKEMLAIAMSPNLSISLSHEAMDLIMSGGTKFGRMTDDAVKKLGLFMSLSETSSRKAAFLAAFDLSMGNNGDFAKALKLGGRTIVDTLYDYSAANRPKFLTGNFGRLFGQFRVYQVQTLFKIYKLANDSLWFNSLSPEERKLARKELALLLSMNFSLAGVVGLPGMATVVTLMNAFQMLAGDDDEPWDAEMEIANGLKEMFGEGVGSALMKGPLPAMLGMDISKRVGAGGITSVFQSDPPEGKHGADLAGWYASNILGPTYSSFVTEPLKAAEAYRKGDLVDALRMGMPKPVKDLAKAYSVATEGMKTGSGQVLKPAEDFNVYQVALAALGVNPLEMSLASEDYRMTTTYDTKIKERRGELTRNFVRAAGDEGSFEDLEKARDEIRQFNERMPSFRLKASSLTQAVKADRKKQAGVESKSRTAVKEEYIAGEEE